MSVISPHVDASGAAPRVEPRYRAVYRLSDGVIHAVEVTVASHQDAVDAVAVDEVAVQAAHWGRAGLRPRIAFVTVPAPGPTLGEAFRRGPLLSAPDMTVVLRRSALEPSPGPDLLAAKGA